MGFLRFRQIAILSSLVLMLARVAFALDPYVILGVPRDASVEQIQKSYRRLAMKLHPDRRPDDKTAEEQFKKAKAAWELLKDPRQKALYDQGRLDLKRVWPSDWFIGETSSTRPKPQQQRPRPTPTATARREAPREETWTPPPRKKTWTTGDRALATDALDYSRDSKVYNPSVQRRLRMPWTQSPDHYSEYYTRLPELVQSLTQVYSQTGSGSATKYVEINFNELLEHFAEQIKTREQLGAFKSVMEKYSKAELSGYFRKNGEERETAELIADLSSRLKASLAVRSAGELSSFRTMNQAAPIRKDAQTKLEETFTTNIQRYFAAFAKDPDSHSTLAEMLQDGVPNDHVVEVNPRKFDSPTATRAWYLAEGRLGKGSAQIDFNLVTKKSQLDDIRDLLKKSSLSSAQLQARLQETLGQAPKAFELSKRAMNAAASNGVYVRGPARRIFLRSQDSLPPEIGKSSTQSWVYDSSTTVLEIDSNQLLRNFSEQIKNPYQLEAFKAVMEKYKDADFASYFSDKPPSRVPDVDNSPAGELIADLSSRLKASLAVHSDEQLASFRSLNDAAPIRETASAPIQAIRSANIRGYFSAFAEAPHDYAVLAEMAADGIPRDHLVKIDPRKFDNPFATRAWYLSDQRLDAKHLDEIDFSLIKSQDQLKAVQVALAKKGLSPARLQRKVQTAIGQITEPSTFASCVVRGLRGIFGERP